MVRRVSDGLSIGPPWGVKTLFFTPVLHFQFLSKLNGIRSRWQFFISILNQMNFYLAYNWKENCHHNHIPFNLKEFRKVVACKSRNVTEYIIEKKISVSCQQSNWTKYDWILKFLNILDLEPYGILFGSEFDLLNISFQKNFSPPCGVSMGEWGIILYIESPSLWLSQYRYDWVFKTVLTPISHL